MNKRELYKRYKSDYLRVVKNLEENIKEISAEIEFNKKNYRHRDGDIRFKSKKVYLKELNDRKLKYEVELKKEKQDKKTIDDRMRGKI